ncbi:putative 3-methyladenine DNA glycosylase [bioreactor metagenome]|uniref:Putative 3-methyladenine DNA glycosylase n=1 Tax=bioreactor metagenome TaxID=1076179 RepID=A0A644XWH7_9ZZZZ
MPVAHISAGKDKGDGMEKLGREFFNRDTLTVARSLLGKRLVRVTGEGTIICRITETEAYVGRIDKACHAYGYRRTKRNETLFAPPGTVYIYFIYGMYYCLNFVTEPEGEPSAVLIRGAEPVEGEGLIARNRFGKDLSDLSAYQKKNLLNGPGKLCKALALTTAQNGLSLTGDELFVLDAGERPARTEEGPRIGVDYAEECAAFPWRFWIPGAYITKGK